MLLAAAAIVYAIRHAPRAEQRQRQPLHARVRPVLTGRLGRLMVGVSAFEVGNVAATLLRWKDITDSIEHALDELARVAHTVEGIALKHA